MHEIIERQAFMCPGCYTIYPVDILFQFNSHLDYSGSIILRDTSLYKYCPICKRKKDHFLVDAEIAEIVRLFNLIGYKTIYSCEGHTHQIKNRKHTDYGKWRAGNIYVMIKGKKKLSKKLFKELVKNNFNDFSTGQDKTHKDVDIRKPEDVERLLNSTTFSIHCNSYEWTHFTFDTQKEAEDYLAINRQNLLNVLTKYYNDMKKRRKKNESYIRFTRKKWKIFTY